MKELKNLLQQVATITQKNNELLDATGGRQIVKTDAFFESSKQRVEILLDTLKGLKL